MKPYTGGRGEFFEYDPLTGVTQNFEATSDGQWHIHSYQDVEPIIDACKNIANAGSADEAWRKNGVAMYAQLPLAVVGQMMKKNINVLDQNDMPKVLKEINTTYPYLKTTNKFHSIRNK